MISYTMGQCLRDPNLKCIEQLVFLEWQKLPSWKFMQNLNYGSPYQPNHVNQSAKLGLGAIFIFPLRTPFRGKGPWQLVLHVKHSQGSKKVQILIFSVFLVLFFRCSVLGALLISPCNSFGCFFLALLIFSCFPENNIYQKKKKEFPITK